MAKRIAMQLNGQPIGGKKRSAYYFDLWWGPGCGREEVWECVE